MADADLLPMRDLLNRGLSDRSGQSMDFTRPVPAHGGIRSRMTANAGILARRPAKLNSGFRLTLVGKGATGYSGWRP
jgi:hypothetical protein